MLGVQFREHTVNHKFAKMWKERLDIRASRIMCPSARGGSDTTKEIPMEQTYTLPENARRGAKRMIAAGVAPGVEFDLHTAEDGRISIVLKRAAAEGPVEEMPGNEADEDADCVAIQGDEGSREGEDIEAAFWEAQVDELNEAKANE